MTRDTATGRQYLRWTRGERLQHWILAGSFVVLAVTGFALKYSESWWSAPLVSIELHFGGRGHLHRIAATAYALLALYHVGYLAFSDRGRRQFKALLPTRLDMLHVGQNFRFMLGRREDPPDFDHFSYGEKVEYWALVWGTVIMGGTGFLLWFQGFSLRFMPLWGLQIMTTIHLFEAWLATLAILVWHLYAVVFNPEVYPLNTSMVDGYLPERLMAAEHAAELARLRAEEAAQRDQNAPAGAAPRAHRAGKDQVNALN